MFVLEYKVNPKPHQIIAIDEAIRTVQFVRNKALRYWMDNRGVGKTELFRYNTRLRKEFKSLTHLNSHACQAAIERVLKAINKFYDNCKKQVKGKKRCDPGIPPYPPSPLLFPPYKGGLGGIKGGWERAPRQVQKSLSTRTHICPHCGFICDRDINAAINILQLGLSRVGRTRTHASGEMPSWLVGEILLANGNSLNDESPCL